MKFTILEKKKGDPDEMATRDECDSEDLYIRLGRQGGAIPYLMSDKPTVEDIEKYAKEMIESFNVYARATNQQERELVGVIADVQ